MPAKRKRLNRRNIASNLEEAVQEIHKLHGLASDGKLTVEELQIGLLHAYHHMNWAWNTRYMPDSKHKNLTQSQFTRWGKYPIGIEEL